jgi:hypothetical protein
MMKPMQKAAFVARTLVMGAAMLAIVLVLGFVGARSMPRSIGDSRAVGLALVEWLAVLAVVGFALRRTWIGTTDRAPSSVIPLLLVIAAMGLMAFATLGFLTLANCCQFDRSFPIGGDCAC